MKKINQLISVATVSLILTGCVNNEILNNSSSNKIEETSSTKAFNEKKEYFPDGKLANTIKLKDGIEIERISYKYLETGELDSKITYKNNYIVFKEFFYKDSSLFSEETYSNNLLNGDKKVFYPNGNLLMVMSYINGKREGISNAFDINGKIASEYNYSNDIIVSEIAFEYYDTGELNYKRIYKDEKLNGLVTKYYKNGKIELEINFINGVGNGEFNQYYENGNLKQTNYLSMAKLMV